MIDTKKTLAQISALAGLGIEGEAGDLVAEAVALLAQRLPRGGEALGREGTVYIPAVPAVTLGPTPQTEPAQQGPALGVWLGRAPTEEERRAHARAHESGRVPEGPRAWWAVRLGDVIYIAEYCGHGESRVKDAAPARDELHARELIAARVASKPDHDPRIGEWCRDSDGDEGLVVSGASGNNGSCLYAITKWGPTLSLLEDATIITPPDPIPEPCRPAWEAFRALEARDG